MDYMMLEPCTNECMGFIIEQVYEAYCDKNKVNYQRLESGY